jgi:hypothetical protein
MMDHSRPLWSFDVFADAIFPIEKKKRPVTQHLAPLIPQIFLGHPRGSLAADDDANSRPMEQFRAIFSRLLSGLMMRRPGFYFFALSLHLSAALFLPFGERFGLCGREMSSLSAARPQCQGVGGFKRFPKRRTMTRK